MDDPNDLEAARRARAHAIWEREGRPEGRHAEHWDEAGREPGEPSPPPPPVGSAGEREARGQGDKPIPHSAPANPNLDPAAR